MTTAWGGAKDADFIMFLIDSERGLKGDAETILEGLKEVHQPKILVLNKVDRVNPARLPMPKPRCAASPRPAPMR